MQVVTRLQSEVNPVTQRQAQAMRLNIHDGYSKIFICLSDCQRSFIRQYPATR